MEAFFERSRHVLGSRPDSREGIDEARREAKRLVAEMGGVLNIRWVLIYIWEE